MLYNYCSLPASLFLLMLCSCSGNKEAVADATHKSFTVLEATYENWHAGRKEGGSGTDYRFLTVINTDKELRFDSIWIQQQQINLPLSLGRLRGPVSNQPVTFQKGDTILLTASFSSGESIPASPATTDTSKAAYISFKEDGKLKKAIIRTLNKKEGLPRPQY